MAAQEDSVAKQKAEVRRKLRERRVPSSPIGRAMGFAQLGASLVYGTVSDSVQQYFRGAPADADTKPGNRWRRPSSVNQGTWSVLFWYAKDAGPQNVTVPSKVIVG